MNSAKLVLVSNPFDPEIHEIDIVADVPISKILAGYRPQEIFLNKEPFDDLSYVLKEGDELAYFLDPEDASTLIYVALALVAATAIYTLTQLPDEPDQLDRSNTYSLRGAQNVARLGEPVPVQYGEMKVYPDLITAPWVEYVSNEQYLHQVFAVGKGEFTISDIRLSDTPIANFDDVQTETVYEGPVTLFPSNVENSIEVANQELSTTITGPFVANSANTDINKISVDVVFAEGIYRARSSGRIEQISVGNIVVEYQEIDDTGTPIGIWTTGVNTALVGRSLSPLRLTYSFTVTSGRYQVRVTRSQNQNASQQKVHDRLLWEGMRGFIEDSTTYNNTTLLAVRMRATEQLSSLSARSFNCFAQRHIPIRSGGSWTAAQATRNPAWAIADVLRNSDYGAGKPDAAIDNASFEAFASWCTTGGFNFDGRFDVLTNMWKAMEQIAAVGKAFVVPAFDQIGITIEDTQTLPAWTFNRANMQNEKFQLKYDRSDDYDSIESRYFDEDNDYEEDSLLTNVTGTTDKPRQIDFRRGITNRDHLYIVNKFLASKEAYANLTVEFDTELEGYLPEKGDLISVATDVIGDLSIAGEVIEYSAAGPYLVLSQELDTDQAVQHAVVLRQRDGTVSGPHNGTINASNPARIDLSAALGWDPSPVADEYNVIAAWGELDFSFRDFIVTEINPKSEYVISVEGVVYDARVYDETGTVPPPPTRPELPRLAEQPDVYNIRFENTAFPDIIAVSWQADQGWQYFIIQISTDGGTTWEPSIITYVPYYEIQTPLNDEYTIHVRVRAMGEFAGSWVSASLTNVGDTDYTSPDETITGLNDPLLGADYDMEASITFTWDADADVPQFYWRLLDSNSQVFLDGYTSGNSVTLSRSQIVACATAAPRVSGVIGTFGVYPSSYTQNTNFSNGQTQNILNAQMAAPNNVVLTEAIGAFTVSTTVTSPPNDFKGMQIFVGDTPGFTPSETTNLVYDGDYAPIIVIPSEVSIGDIRYVRVGLYDEFGKDNISLFSEQSITITNNIENDFVVAQQFGSSLIQNSYLDQARARANGTIVPAGWYLNGNAETDLQYSDSDRDKVNLTTSAGTAEMLSLAFQPNSDAEYEIIVRIRSTTGTPTVSYGVMESYTAPATDKVSVTASIADTFIDPQVEAGADNEASTTAALTTSFSRETYTYTPNASTLYASLFVRADASESYEIDYVYVRDATAYAANAQTFFYQATAPSGQGEVTDDYWIDSDNNQLHRYNGATWDAIPDNGIAQAIADAAGAQGTADNKVYVFAQAAAPVDGDHPEGNLEEGDLWVETDNNNRLYRWDETGQQWVDYGQLEADWGLVTGTGRPENYALAVTPGILPDPSFDREADVGNEIWWDQTGDWSISATAGPEAGPAATITTPTTLSGLRPNNPGRASTNERQVYQARNGQRLWVRGLFWKSASYSLASGDTDFKCEMIFFDEAMVALSSPNVFTGDAVNSMADTTWTILGGHVDCTDAETHWAQPQVWLNGPLGASGELRCAWLQMYEYEPEATIGAILGTNLQNEAGDILSDIDVRNDQVVTRALAALNFNPGFEFSRRLAGGTLAPAGWFGDNTTTALGYVDDATRDELTTSAGVVNSAFRVEPGTTYEVIIRARRGLLDTNNVSDVTMEEYHTDDLGTNFAIGASATGESGVVLADNSVTITGLNNLNLGTTFAVYSGTYTPASNSVKWASVRLASGSGVNNFEFDWVVVRDRTTVGATAGTNLYNEAGVVLDDIHIRNDELVSNALSSLNYNPGFNIARQSDLSGYVPAGWYRAESGVDPEFVNPAVVDKILKMTSVGNSVTSAAIRVEPNNVYEVVMRARATLTPTGTFDINIQEYDTDLLGTGIQAIGPNGATNETGVQDSTRTKALDPIRNNHTFTTVNVWEVIISEYVPTNTAKWASIFFGNEDDVEIDWCIIRDKATPGAVTGTNLLNEAGDILADLDIRNDQLVTEELGAVNFNPSMRIPADRSGTLAPAGYTLDSTNAFPTYESDTTRDILEVAGTNSSILAQAFRVNANTSYEIAALIKMDTTTTNVDLSVDELYSELTTGNTWVGPLAYSQGVQARDASQVVVDDQSVGTTYEVISGIYTPNASTVWASPRLFRNGSTNTIHVEWMVVRDRSSLGATAGTDLFNNLGAILDDIDIRNDQIVENALASINPNPGFNQTRQSDLSNLVPMGWYRSGSTVDPDFVDETVVDKILDLSSGAMSVSSSAIRIEPDTVYEVVMRARATNAPAGAFDLSVMEYDTDLLGDGIVGVGLGTDDETGLVASTRNKALDPTRQNHTFTTINVWEIVTGNYTPTSTAKWASIHFGNEAGVEVDWCLIRSKSTFGATSGTSVFDESGNILSDIDLRNDQLITGEPGTINFNPSMSIPRTKSTTELAPAGWFGVNTIVDVQYESNAVRDIMTTGASVANTAIPVSPNSQYVIIARIKVGPLDATNVSDITINEYNSDALPSGKLAIGSASTGESQVQTGDTTLIDIGLTNIALTAADTYEVVTSNPYTPSQGAAWASVQITAGSGVSVLSVDWLVVRDLAASPGSQVDLSGLLFNSGMNIRDFNSTITRPAGWFLSGTTDETYLSYQDSNRSVLKLGVESGTDTVACHSTAFQVNPNVIYRVVVRLRGNVASDPGPGGLYIRIAELDGDLNEGALFLKRPSLNTPTYDDQFDQEPTRELVQTTANNWTRISGGTDFENDPVPDTYTEYIGDYQPTSSSTKWAGISILNWADHDDEIWIDRVTVEINPGALGAQDTVGRGDIDDDAVSSQGTGTDTVTSVNSATYVEVATATVDFGSDITSSEAFAIFFTDVEFVTTSVGARTVTLQLEDHDNVEVTTHDQVLRPTASGTDARLISGHYVKTATQTVTATEATVTGFSEVIDPTADFSIAGGSDITLPEGGQYIINVSMDAQKETTGAVNMGFYIKLQEQDPAVTGSWTDVSGAYSRASMANVGSTTLDGGTAFFTTSVTSLLNPIEIRVRAATYLSGDNEAILSNGNITILRVDTADDNAGTWWTDFNIAQVFNIPAANMNTGSNTFKVNAQLSSTSNVTTANMSDSRLLIFARHK